MATVVQWTVEDVSAWLGQCLHLPYADGFARAGIDGVQLVHLTHQGLLGLGVDTEEHIKCLLDHIAVLRIQWERSLSCQDAEMRKSLNASMRSASADVHRKRMGTVWPRVGSPILHAMPVKFHRPEERAVKEGVSDQNLDFAVKAEGGKVQETRGRETKHPVAESKKDVKKAEAGEPGRVSSEPDLAVDPSTRVAVGGSEPNPAVFVDGLHTKPILLPAQRSPTPLSMHDHGASSARASEAAVSRCSSAPAYKRGPSAAAEGGASLFLSDQSRGAFFGTTARGVEILPDSLGPGPARYDADAAASKISLRANIGAMKFSCEPRRTMECMFVRGVSGPGSGKYHPPPRSTSRGGSFSRAPRWNSRYQIRSLPASAPAPPGPGPSSYKPIHSALSTLR